MAEWTIYVHEDGRYVSINDGRHGDTLLRIGGQAGDPGHLDVQAVRDFAEWVRANADLGRELYEALKTSIVELPGASPHEKAALARYEREVGLQADRSGDRTDIGSSTTDGEDD
jgi:hypothetical protein